MMILRYIKNAMLLS